MAIYSGTKIVNNGLVLHIDSANTSKNTGLNLVEYLVVGGGGAGGGGVRYSGGGGGGGGGGVLFGQTTVTFQSYVITVGAGGSATGNLTGTNGGNSSFNSVTALGGGGGGRAGSGSTTNTGLNGSSGGGGGATTPGNTVAAGQGTTGQGFNGGLGSLGGNYNGGGGGGAGEPGKSGTVDSSGGNGISSGISGTPTFYGGGGAGGAYTTAGTRLGGLGGGGNSGLTDGSPGTPNTGGGGGGSGISSNTATVYTPGAGGSGIVIIRYPGPQRAIGGTVTKVGNYTVHSFTSTGTSSFTVLSSYVDSQAVSGTTDFSNSGNFAKPVNGTLYSSSFGGCFLFDGTADALELYNFPQIFSNSITFEGWYYFNESNTRDILFGNYDGSPAINFERHTSDRLRLYWNNGANDIYTGNNVAPANKWLHICMIRNKELSKFQFFVNGALVSDQNVTSADIATAASTFRIGRDIRTEIGRAHV